MVIVALPAPTILAPIWLSITARSMISGSRAALSMTVVPWASTAAIKMFSVAPTLGKSRPICAPRSRSAAPTTMPCSMLIVAPSARRPLWCMSRGREPMASPPGSATLARWQRPINGPSTQTDARRRPTAGKSALCDRSAGVVMVTSSPDNSTRQPRPMSTSAISGTSRIAGQLEMTVVPSASNAAAISLRTLFLAPATDTSPERRAPPVTRKRSSTAGTLTRRSHPAAPPNVARPLGRDRSSGTPRMRRLGEMAVHLTRIYTRTGDDGTTGLSDFSRVSKTDPRLVAYADCDETNAALGVVMALGTPAANVAAVIVRLQNELFDLGADLATPIAPDPKYPPLRVTQQYIDRLELDCDPFNESLPPL